MCGIVGISFKTPPGQRDVLARMRDTMSHRGPDDAGEWWSPDGRVALGQRRLAIIDLSPGGHQPMQDATGQLCIVFNGEIYNYLELRDELSTKGHTFRSASDTEVILAAYREWGTECLARLNGMFAFCLYDSRTQQLFLARDRAGEKPLFFFHSDKTFVFASELKAILAVPEVPRQLDLESFEFYLTYGYAPGARCMLRGARKLAAAHALVLNLNDNQLKVWRYWSIPEPDEAPCSDAEQLTDELQALVEDAVRRQLIADVPVGILLSGGVDSSLVTALASKVSSKQVQTFNIAFPGHGSYDESEYATLVAKHFGTQHTKLEAQPATVELLPVLARQYDEPMCDSSMIPTYLVTRLIRQNCTVALGGDGGDELFGGYMSYSYLLKQRQLKRWIPSPMRALMSTGAQHFLAPGFRGRNYLLGLHGNLEQGQARANMLFDSTFRKRLLSPLSNGHFQPGMATEEFKIGLSDRRRGYPGAAMAVDFQSYLVDDILVKVDRASMLASLELRAPFLDYRVIEFAFRRVPNTLRANTVDRKILLRKLAARLLPKELDLRRKQGFSIPLHTWFKGEWGRYMREVLESADRQIFNPKAIAALLKNQDRGYSNSERLFALTLFELWRREYKVSV